MNERRARLIAQLGEELTPVRRPGSVSGLLMVWLGLSVAWTLLMLHLTGEWRAGAAHQLVDSPRFATETVVGVVSGIGLALAGLRLGIPTPRSPLLRTFPALLVTLIWIGLYVQALLSEAVPPSMLGKREWCEFETLLYSLPPMLLGLLMLRRLVPLAPRRAAAVMGLAAGLVPALGMQFACMYEPFHTLDHHLAPALLTAALATVLAPWVLSPPRRSPLERARG